MTSRTDSTCLAAASGPPRLLCQNVAALVDGDRRPVVAEIGIGIGATTRELARMLDGGNGDLHLYDFQPKIVEILEDLRGSAITMSWATETCRGCGTSTTGAS